MPTNLRYMLLNLPSPPGFNIFRGFAGGFGTAEKSKRKEFGHDAYILLPIFLVYASSALQKMGRKFSVLDAQALGYDSSQLIQAMLKEKPDVLFVLISLPSLYADLELLNKIKESCPDTFIVALGTVCNVMPEEVLNSRVDIVLQGYYPYYNAVYNFASMDKNFIDKDLMEKIPGIVYKNNNKINICLPPLTEEINDLSFQVYRSLSIPKYLQVDQKLNGSRLELFPILIDVGCPYPCTHCPYPTGYGNQIIHKSIEAIIQEIQFLKQEFGISGFIFRAQVFTQNRERVEKLCDEILKNNLNINWMMESRPNLISKELLLKMKNAGCFRINYGIESGNSDLLEKVGRSTNVDTIKKTFKLTKEFGIWTHAHMILGFPGENKNTLNNTFNLICQLNPDSTSWNLLTPYPGTKFFDLAKKNGWINTSDWSKYTSFDPIIRTNEMSENQFLKLEKNLKLKLCIFRLLHNSDYRKRVIKNIFINKL